MRITNLDSLNDEDQVIILDGKEWTIPGEIQVDYVLRLIDLQQKIAEAPTEVDLWESQQRILAEIFQKRHPEITFEKLKVMLTAKQTGALINVLMNSIGSPEEVKEKKTELLEQKEESQKSN